MAVNIAAMQQLPNVAGNFQQGYAFGQQQRAAQQQRADQERLRQLSPQIIGGDPSAFAEASAIDPKAASAQIGAGDQIARRAEGLVKLLEDADARDPREAQALWQNYGVPFARQFSQGTEPTADWQQAKPMLASLKARIAMAKSAQDPAQDPTGFREAHMKAVAAGYQPGTEEYQRAMRVSLGTEGRAATGGFGFELVTGPDGRQRYSRRNPRTGQVEIYDENSGDFVPLGGGASLNGGVPAPQNRMPDEQIIATANSMIRSGIPEAQVEAWMRQQQGQQQFVGNATPNPNLGVSQSPAEKAFATEAGQQQAQLATLRERGQIEAENAGAAAAAKAQAENAAERSKSGIAKAPQLLNVERGLARIDSALSTLESGRFGDTGPVDQIYQRYTPAGQELEAAVGAIQNDMLALTRVPGVGSQSDLEAKIANLKYPSLSNDPTVNRRNLQQLRAFISDLAESLGRAPSDRVAAPSFTQPPQQSARQAPQPGTVQDGYRFKGGNPADPNSWERL